MAELGRLASAEHWSNFWANSARPRLPFDPFHPQHRDMHRCLMRALPRGEGVRFLEVGCYPGRYMWYFRTYFGYEVAGLEYVAWCAEATERLLHEEGIEGTVIHGDLFEFTPEPSQQWDVVASFGFVEHFKDTIETVRRHLTLVKPGGSLVIVIPNHAGLYGWIMDRVDPRKAATHKRIAYAELRRAVEACGADLVVGGYDGRIGFWNCALYPWLRSLGQPWSAIGRVAFRGIERVGRILPNSALLSPTEFVVGRVPSAGK